MDEAKAVHQLSGDIVISILAYDVVNKQEPLDLSSAELIEDLCRRSHTVRAIHRYQAD